MSVFFAFFVFKWVVRIGKQHRVRVLLGGYRNYRMVSPMR